MSDIAHRLRRLHAAKQRILMAGGQMMGGELYRLRASAVELAALIDGADHIEMLERELSAIKAQASDATRNKHLLDLLRFVYERADEISGDEVDDAQWAAVRSAIASYPDPMRLTSGSGHD